MPEGMARMEHVFPIEVSLSSASMGDNRKNVFSSMGRIKVGVVEKIVEPGKFVVSFADGVKVKVQGQENLKIGNRVQVHFDLNQMKGNEKLPAPESLDKQEESGIQLSAFLPLGFGGKGATARLEVFIERQSGNGLNKFIPAIYFVFVVQTKELGETQWSIHMKGRQVSIQVFASGVQKQREKLKLLALDVEKGLKNKGFVLSAPTVYLNRRFTVPSGFRLNVSG
jgi:hypothetical protein